MTRNTTRPVQTPGDAPTNDALITASATVAEPAAADTGAMTAAQENEVLRFRMAMMQTQMDTLTALVQKLPQAAAVLSAGTPPVVEEDYPDAEALAAWNMQTEDTRARLTKQGWLVHPKAGINYGIAMQGVQGG